ncbi:hypothetical protein OESDEN_19357, partial [Oesophagostomum dentatum]
MSNITLDTEVFIGSCADQENKIAKTRATQKNPRIQGVYARQEDILSRESFATKAQP